MKVKELVDILNGYDQEATVYVDCIDKELCTENECNIVLYPIISANSKFLSDGVELICDLDKPELFSDSKSKS